MTASIRNYNAIRILNRVADVHKAEFETVDPARLWVIGTFADSFDDLAQRVGTIRTGETSGGIGWVTFPEGGERFTYKGGGRWNSDQQVRIYIGVIINGSLQDVDLTRDPYFIDIYEKSREIALRNQDWQDENGDPLATDTNLTNAGMRPTKLANGQRLMTFSYYLNVNYPFWLGET